MMKRENSNRNMKRNTKNGDKNERKEKLSGMDNLR